jgi:co-chaperonin GroES (HSP10)
LTIQRAYLTQRANSAHDGRLPYISIPAVGDEPWKEPVRETRFVTMQARRGDYALFFRKASVEITFENERYLVVPQAAILALVRE